MAAFWNRQGTHQKCDEQLAALRGEVAELRQRVTAAERTVSECAEASYRQLKKAEAAARRALEAAEAGNQDSAPRGEVAPSTPLFPPLTGARARIMARRLRGAAGLPPSEDTNGVHP